jgi:hypothetical protein
MSSSQFDLQGVDGPMFSLPKPMDRLAEEVAAMGIVTPAGGT